MPAAVNTFSVTPNVTSGGFFASFSIPQSSFVSMKIYDVTGRLIDVPFTEDLKQGVHKKTINTSKLNNGTYFVVLETESSQQVEKIVVTK